MRQGPIHPLASLLAYVGWTALAVPLSAFAGAVTFGAKAGTLGALLGLLVGTAMGMAFVLAWHWIGGRSPQTTASAPPPRASGPPRSTNASNSLRVPTHPGQPLSVPPEYVTDDIVRGAAALDEDLMELPSKRESLSTFGTVNTERPTSPTDTALAIHEAALNDDLDRALMILRNAWDLRDHMYLDPSTALAVGEWAAALGDLAVGRWCLAQGKAANPQRVASLEQRLAAFMAETSGKR